MDEENVNLLINALRSRKYKQTTQQLKYNDGYCCLGVACDVFRKETGKGSWENDSFVVMNEDESDNFLPFPVAQWYGFDDGSPTMSNDMNLVYENDGGSSFITIASYLQKELEG